ncbi:MAG: MATE family efflux transporter [Clostridiales bacterium]|jgi:putative MATE family efflux protein|nr:MATE family efflux transporter [Clostridiales bacterium]
MKLRLFRPKGGGAVAGSEGGSPHGDGPPADDFPSGSQSSAGFAKGADGEGGGPHGGGVPGAGLSSGGGSGVPDAGVANGDSGSPHGANPSVADFSSGSVAGRILRLAVPMTLAQLVNLLYNIFDRIWLGRWQGDGTLALASVGLAFPIIAAISAFTGLCTAGSLPLFSISRGAGDAGRAASIMGNAFAMLLVAAAALTVAGLALRRPLLFLVGASDAIIGDAEEYLAIYLGGTVFAMCGLGMNGFINAQGFGRVGMLSVLLGAVLNIALDPLFIYGFGMGVKGAAVATVISQMCSAAWIVRFLAGGKAVIRLRLRDMRLSAPIVRRSLALGLAGFTMQLTNSAVGAVYNVAMQDLGGDLYVGVMVVIHSIQEIIQLPGMGLTQAAQPVMSFNYGAGRHDRVRAAMKFISFASLSIHVIFWLVALIFTEGLIRIFNGDPTLIATGVVAARAYFAVFFLMAFQGLGQAGFVSLGMTKRAIFFSVLRKGVIVIPFVLLFGYALRLGAGGVFYAEPVSHVLGSVTCYLVFMLTVWRKLGKGPQAGGLPRAGGIP